MDGVGKMYKVFPSRTENLLDAMGVARFFGDRQSRHTEFWALRGINLELRRGERIGVIGRNGAGKTTLLKLILGHLRPTEGTVEVQGKLQALLEIGGGLHPEFSGYENIEAALAYYGLSRAELRAAVADIEEFTELGEFLSQPFKVYSAGMKTRLALAIATSIQPDILIIDEVLGTGDSYFYMKSVERMQNLVEGGASVLLASHALYQIQRFCRESIWIDRGQVVMAGPTNEVTKAYEKFIRVLDERRLRAKNRKLRSKSFTSIDHDRYTETMMVRLTVDGANLPSCDVSEVALIRDAETEDRVLVGGPQDADPSQTAFVVVDSGHWSAPKMDSGQLYRTIRPSPAVPAWGSVQFHLWAYFAESTYQADLQYRCESAGTLTVELLRAGNIVRVQSLPVAAGWQSCRVEIPGAAGSAQQTGSPPSSEGAVSRWPGHGGLSIERVALIGSADTERAVFQIGEPLKIRLVVRAHEAKTFDLIPAALIFRMDGIVVTRHIGKKVSLELDEGQEFIAELDCGELLLGNGEYAVSVGLYRELELDNSRSAFYDYLDRSYEFSVTGSPPLHNELLRHPGTWHIGPPKKD